MEKPTLALVAHDSKKPDMVCLIESHHSELTRFNLVATRNTGELVHSRSGLEVSFLQSGPHGGDQQIGSLVAHGNVMAVVFLRDPLAAQAHEPDISALLRVCDVHNIPLATNLATAEIILHFLFEHSGDVGPYQFTTGYHEKVTS